MRIDSHSATETRGRFARICIQVDVDKPLVTAVLIGKFEQAVCYEGLQRLCFSCGRIGHRKESCPYTIRPEPRSREVVAEEVEDQRHRACNLHVPDNTREEVGPSKIMHESEQEELQNSTYGPWIVVARRKNGTKSHGSGGSHTVPGNGQLRQVLRKSVTEARFSNNMGSFKANDGPVRVSKRKLMPLKSFNEAHFA